MPNDMTPKRGYAFKDFARRQPSSPLPGDRLDTELDRLVKALEAQTSYFTRAISPDGQLIGRIVSKQNIKHDVLDHWVNTVSAALEPRIEKAEIAERNTQNWLTQAKESAKQAQEALSQTEKQRSQSLTDVLAIQEAKSDASRSRGRAESAQVQAQLSGQDAATSAASARLSEDMAYRWAEKLDGPVYVPTGGDPVDDGFYSSKWWARYANITVENGSYWYLGVHPDPPTTGNDGGPLMPGMWYFDSTSNQTYIWDGTSWDAISGNTGEVISVFGRKGTVQALQGDYAAFYSLLGHLHTENEITDLDKYTQAEVDARIGAVSDDLDVHLFDLNNPHLTSWDNLRDKPDDFPPSVHTHIETDITDLDRVRWEGEWLSGAVRARNDMVRDGQWTMISLEDGNSDRPAPQPEGNPEWSLDDVPGWTERPHTGVVRSGMEFDIGPSPVEVQGWEVWVPALSASTSYVLFVYTYPTGQPELIQFEQLAEPLLVEDGWATVKALKTLVTPGTTLGFIIDALNSGASSPVTGGWSRSVNNNDLASDPGVGGWGQNTQATSLRLSFTDLDSVDRKTEIMGMIAGTDITFADTVNPNLSLTYRVTVAPTDSGTHGVFSVQLTDTGASGAPAVGATTTMTAAVPVPQSTNYVELSGDPGPTWAAATRGTLAFDGVPQAGVETNAYGIRVLGDRYNKSDKWDIVAYAGGSAGGGGDSGGGTGETRATTGPVFPTDADNGDLHYLSVDPVGLYVYFYDGDSFQWVTATDTNVGGGGGGEGGAIYDGQNRDNLDALVGGSLTHSSTVYGAPDGVTTAQTITITQDNDQTGSQILVDQATNQLYTRTKTLDAWNEWSAVGGGGGGDPVTIVEADTSAGWQVWGDTLIQWGTVQATSNTTVAPYVQPFKAGTTPRIAATSVNGGDASITFRAGNDHLQFLPNAIVQGVVGQAFLDWVAIGEAPDDLKQPKEVSGGGGGGASVTTGATFPTDPAEGDLHYMTADNPGLFVFYVDPTSSQWVQTNGGVAEGEPVTIVDSSARDLEGHMIVGDILMQWGTATTSGGIVVKTLPIPYDAADYVVVASTTGTNNTGVARNCAISTVTETTIQFYARSISSDNVTTYDGLVRWHTMGPVPAGMELPKTLTGVGGGATEAFHDPTGAASWKIDHASNTLECWGAYYTGAGGTGVTFPKTFANDFPRVSLGVLNSEALLATYQALTSGGMYGQGWDTTGTQVAASVSYHVIGEWDGN